MLTVSSLLCRSIDSAYLYLTLTAFCCHYFVTLLFSCCLDPPFLPPLTGFWPGGQPVPQINHFPAGHRSRGPDRQELFSGGSEKEGFVAARHDGGQGTETEGPVSRARCRKVGVEGAKLLCGWQWNVLCGYSVIDYSYTFVLSAMPSTFKSTLSVSITQVFPRLWNILFMAPRILLLFTLWFCLRYMKLRVTPTRGYIWDICIRFVDLRITPNIK